MNALLQIALMRAVDTHGYQRPEWAKCYKVDDERAYFHFVSEHGKEVGYGEFSDSAPLGWPGKLIINQLVTAVRIVTGEAEHNYRRQVRQAAKAALTAFPDQRQSILQTVSFLVR
ncbi:MAG: hypothetical protein BGO59_25995 [Spirosoma sp. 48-14]|nr:MAG: hypothetical protein BGO59_25995 [Spirosoma sp. 48-14]